MTWIELFCENTALKTITLESYLFYCISFQKFLQIVVNLKVSDINTGIKQSKKVKLHKSWFIYFTIESTAWLLNFSFHGQNLKKNYIVNILNIHIHFSFEFILILLIRLIFQFVLFSSVCYFIIFCQVIWFRLIMKIVLVIFIFQSKYLLIVKVKLIFLVSIIKLDFN